MRILPGIVCILLYAVFYTEGSCPENTDALKMCYEGTRSGPTVYLQTALTSDSTVTECSCTVTTFVSGTEPAQVNFIPNQVWPSCYYKQLIMFESATATYSCTSGGNRLTSFFDMKDNSTVTVSLQEDYKSGSSAVDACYQIKAYTSNVNLQVKCFKVLTQQETTTTQQVTTTTQQETKTTQKERTTTLQETTTTQRVPTTTQQESTTTQQESTTTQQKSTTKQQESTTKQQESTTKQHHSTTKQHDSTTKQHKSTTKQQESTTKQHESTTKQNGDDVTKPGQGYIVPIGLGVGSFLILVVVGIIVVCICNKCVRQKNIEPGVENDYAMLDINNAVNGAYETIVPPPQPPNISNDDK